MPATAPVLLMRVEKMPIISAGKIEAAAKSEGQAPPSAPRSRVD
jgi:hypothetical protein